MKTFAYKGKHKKEISFPVGGIGAGCVGIAGNGAIIDWQIKGRPNHGGRCGFTHFAVKAEKDGKVLDARVLNGDLDAEYTGIGEGAPRLSMAGMPHFKEAAFVGEYPFCQMEFRYPKFPGIVRETVFNPLIPLNEDDSSIPGALFVFEIENTTKDTLDYTLAFAGSNPATPGHTKNRFELEDGLSRLFFTGDDLTQGDVGYIDMTMATDWQDCSYQEYYYRGFWFDQLLVYWEDLIRPGRFENRTYTENVTSRDPDGGVLAAHVSLLPGEKKTVRFALSWHVPNMVKYWKDAPAGEESRPHWKHYYAKLFEDSRASASYLLCNYDRLYAETKAFHDALFSSTLPESVLDAITANLAILKSPTCLRLTNGEFYAFEGCAPTEGWCEGSCTHVWNYAYTLAFLFPRLERSMRDLDYAHNYHEDGSMTFRLQLPLGSEREHFRPCVDGQMGSVLKVYRDFKISGDRAWLKILWPKVKKTIAFAWSEENTDSWDRNKDGVLEGRQHHTLDMELFGPSAWLNGFYLLALQAGAELAEILDEPKTAQEYRRIFASGQRFLNTALFNGKYFHQATSLEDRGALTEYAKQSGIYGTPADQDSNGWNAEDVYWSEEFGEMKYQIGDGCLCDQMVSQWHANLAGLGRIFDAKKTKKALRSIYRYNYQKDGFRDYANPCRLYALNDEKGITVCSWPEGHRKPKVPIPYSQEVFNGFEYPLAALMLQEGEIKKGLTIIKSARKRYDGTRRNPWREIECGSYYARSLSSYSLLLAYSGFAFDADRKHIGFSPLQEEQEAQKLFRTFFSFDKGWGIFTLKESKAELEILYGSLEIITLNIQNKKAKKVQVNGIKQSFDNQDGAICFKSALSLQKGDSLLLTLAE